MGRRWGIGQFRMATQCSLELEKRTTISATVNRPSFGAQPCQTNRRSHSDYRSMDFLMLPGRQSLCSTRRVAHGKTLCIRSLSNLGPTTIVVYDVMNTSLPCALLVPARVHSPCID